MKTCLFTKIFGSYNFSSLDQPDYKEDAVREDIIAPLLRSVGYSASGPIKMVRGMPLKHPYVLFGTTKKKLTIIPDYVLFVNDKPVFVLDAKAPDQNIETGDNVCQVFSYAIHPEIRVNTYGICNGRRLAIFHINSILPKKVYDLTNATDLDLIDINEKLNPRTVLNDKRVEYIPDGGAYLHFVINLPIQTKLVFTKVIVPIIGIVADKHYNLNVTCNDMADRSLMFSFDFSEVVLDELLNTIPANEASVVRTALSRYPFCYRNMEDPFKVNIHCYQASEAAFSNEGEMFFPLVVSKFEYVGR